MSTADRGAAASLWPTAPTDLGVPPTFALGTSTVLPSLSAFWAKWTCAPKGRGRDESEREDKRRGEIASERSQDLTPTLSSTHDRFGIIFIGSGRLCYKLFCTSTD